jgi:hypothetical protein
MTTQAVNPEINAISSLMLLTTFCRLNGLYGRLDRPAAQVRKACLIPLLLLLLAATARAGYELHIVREKNGKDVPIPLAEWRTAVGQLKGLRLKSGDWVDRNPSTDQVLRVGCRPGDTEYYDVTQKKWLPAFYFFQGRASFQPSGEHDPLMVLSKQLAQCLGARVRGDDGEYY